MKVNSSNYLLKEGIRSIWSHRLMSLASIGVLMSCLVLMGLAVLFSVNVNKGLDAIEDKNVINIYLYDSVTKEQLPQVEAQLKTIDNVKDFTFISKEEAWQKQLESMGAADMFEGLDINTDNILPDSYKVVLKDISQYNDTLTKLKEISQVETIRDSSEIADKLISIRKLITILGGALIIMLFVVSLFIIANTIKLTMYSRRLEISIMKAVGATDGFIRLPFVVEGFVLGLIAGIASFGLVYGIYRLAGSAVTRIIPITPVAFSSIAWWLLSGFIIVGIITGIVGSLISMSRYLKKEGSEISAV